MFVNGWLVRGVLGVELLRMETEWAVNFAVKHLYCYFFVFAVYNGVATHSLQKNRRTGQECVVRVGINRLCVCVCVSARHGPVSAGTAPYLNRSWLVCCLLCVRPQVLFIFLTVSHYRCSDDFKSNVFRVLRALLFLLEFFFFFFPGEIANVRASTCTKSPQILQSPTKKIKSF